MALPASGAISLYDVNVELGRSGTTMVSLDDANVRSLIGISSGAIDLNSAHGKSSFTLAWSANGLSAGYCLIGGAVAWTFWHDGTYYVSDKDGTRYGSWGTPTTDNIANGYERSMHLLSSSANLVVKTSYNNGVLYDTWYTGLPALWYTSGVTNLGYWKMTLTIRKLGGSPSISRDFFIVCSG